MPLNLQTFKTRALTAIVFVVVMLLGLTFNYWSFVALFMLINMGCWFEYQKLVGLINDDYYNISFFHKVVIIICGCGIVLGNVASNYNWFNIPVANIGKWIVIVCFVALPLKEVVLSKKNNIRVLSLSFLGLAYISLSCCLMIDLRNFNYLNGIFVGRNAANDFLIPIILIASIWINDTMAYIVGSLIGKTPLSKISPKKTWEGTIGGAVLAILIVTLVVYFFISNQTKFVLQTMGIASIAAVFGTLGDLLESKLKRVANVKDSGSIMPGHGGFLDRFDSLLVATPIVWLFLKIW